MGKRGDAPPHDAYPVRTVARITGLTPDIIRVWERRYGVVAPVRGPRDARLYRADDIAHLRLLSRLVTTGRAIGDIAKLDRPTLERLAGTAAVAAPQERDTIVTGRLLEALERFDTEAVDQELGAALVTRGAPGFVRQVAGPLLTEIGERWSAGSLSVADEHLLSGVLRNLLSGLLRMRSRPGRPALLLTTPSGERHEFGLLLVGLLAADAGLGLVYLGVDLPAAEVSAAARRADVAVVGISTVGSDNRRQATAQVAQLERALPSGIELWLGGRDAAGVAAGMRHTRSLVIQDLETATTEISRIRSAAQVRR